MGSPATAEGAEVFPSLRIHFISRFAIRAFSTEQTHLWARPVGPGAHIARPFGARANPRFSQNILIPFYSSLVLRVAVLMLRSSSGFGRMKKSGTAAYKIKLAFVLQPASTTAKPYPSIGDE